MDLCHLKNLESEPQHQKYKGRVVLPGDTVKDDSGPYAVFTEQGSSASQMTAAKAMDVIYVQVKQLMQYPLIRRDAPTLMKFQSQNARYLDTSTKSPNGQNHGPVCKIQSFLSKGICAVILWQDYCGKGNLRKFYWNTVEKSF